MKLTGIPLTRGLDWTTPLPYSDLIEGGGRSFSFHHGRDRFEGYIDEEEDGRWDWIEGGGWWLDRLGDDWKYETGWDEELDWGTDG